MEEIKTRKYISSELNKSRTTAVPQRKAFPANTDAKMNGSPLYQTKSWLVNIEEVLGLENHLQTSQLTLAQVKTRL